jgi:trans-aconitate methyltransferase
MTSAADQIIGLYRRHAHNWAEDRGNRLFEHLWLDRFLALQPVGAAIFDIGCGSGQPIGRYLIDKGCAIAGVDSSPELIDLCEQDFPDQDWHVADMRSLALAAASTGFWPGTAFFTFAQTTSAVCSRFSKSMRRHWPP